MKAADVDVTRSQIHFIVLKTDMHKNTSVPFDFTHLYTMVNNRTIGNTVP